LPSLVLKPDNLHEKPLSNYWRIHMLFRCLNLTRMGQGEAWGYTINPCPHENGDLCLGGFV